MRGWFRQLCLRTNKCVLQHNRFYHTTLLSPVMAHRGASTVEGGTEVPLQPKYPHSRVTTLAAAQLRRHLGMQGHSST